MIIILLFALAPLLGGLILEYLVCRLTMRFGRFWKLIPPAAVLIITAVVALGRYRVWSSEESPLPTLLFVPGLPAFFGFLGLLAGWLIWRRLWLPKVVRDRK